MDRDGAKKGAAVVSGTDRFRILKAPQSYLRNFKLKFILALFFFMFCQLLTRKNPKNYVITTFMQYT